MGSSKSDFFFSPKVIFNLSTYNVLALFATVLGSLSVLIWEILWTEEPGGSMGKPVHGVTQSLTRLMRLSTHTHRSEKVCLLRKKERETRPERQTKRKYKFLFLAIILFHAAAAKSLQSCLTL